MKIFKRNPIENKKVSRARWLYYYVVFGSIASLIYFVAAIFRGYPKHFALSPIYLLVALLITHFIYKNFRLIWFFIVNVNRGSYLLYLNRATHWDEGQKMRVVKWAYPKGKHIRKETYDKIAKKLFEEKKISPDEAKRMKHKVVFCPQQMKLGFNEALLVNSLIHAHRYISPLDDDIRDIMNLTEDNILNFDLMREYNKAGGDEYEKMLEVGKRKAAEL